MPDGARSATLAQVDCVLEPGDSADPSDVEQDQGAGLPEVPVQPDDASSGTKSPPLVSAVNNVGNISAPDLISFDTPNALGVTILDITAATSSHPTVDDLLSGSPLLPMSAVTDATADEVDVYLKQTPTPGASPPGPALAIGREESSAQTSLPIDVLIEIDDGVPQDSTSGPWPSRTPSPSERIPPAAPVAAEPLDKAEPDARTPRRSARPSTSPYKTPRPTNESPPRSLQALDPHPADEPNKKSQGAGISIVVDGEVLEKEKKARRRERESRVKGKKKEETSMDLPLMSPTSTDLLTKLMPSPSRSVSPAVQEAEEKPDVPVFLQRSPNDQTQTMPAGVRRPSTPPNPLSDKAQQSKPIKPVALRPANPKLLRPTDRATAASSSPMKFNPSTTPARRIPIAEAVKQGSISPEKAAQVSRRPQPSNAPVFTAPLFRRFPPDLNNPNRSPAKRPPAVEMPSPAKVPAPEFDLNSTKPTAAAAPQRSRSLEAEERAKQGKSIQRPWSADIVPRLDFKGAARPPRNPLPFPINPIPEESELQAQEPSQQAKELPASSPAKSTLRQPSAGSRIPRIGSKPYARPPSSKLPVPQSSRTAAQDVPKVCSAT
ncbi:hypothetical protein OE88DRAFT_973819 [Heliocybe sulcata]|uniref:Uncharacterized protein n=1 Tax=Heliocybe sulcata TaxID=5364 RepID=A0A5C3NC55_9AGAM|nr:hypothetical protein OE88DRAFT_973819 [Heliocybe sulcata]